ncbi:MAG: hypothetical protein QW062_01500 [Thermoplasmatales archaeon]
MKSSVLLVIVIVVIAAFSLFIYSEYHNSKTANQGSHVYIGAIYEGQTNYSNAVSATISFGGKNNLQGNVYYVVLSVWDTNRSYDQVGISSLNGSYFSTYSYTYITKNGSIEYVYDPHWFPIKPGVHQVSMHIYSGNVTFTVDGRSFVAFTGGNHFVISTNELINSVSYSDLTVYEEIYKFSGVLPEISYNFTNICYSIANKTYRIDSWAYFIHNVSVSYESTVFYLGNTVNIYNGKPLTLELEYEGSKSSAQISIADFNFTASGNAKYYIYLLPGKYEIAVLYQGNMDYYTIDLTKNYTMTIQP